MKIDDKVDAVYIPDSPSRIKANDYNQIKNEIQDCITEAGLTPTKDVIQLPQALKILTAQSSAEQVAGIEAKIPAEASETNQLADKQFVQDLTSALNFVQWVDALPETGESKYIYAVPREETDTDGKQIAALYLWDGSSWRGAGAFSLNIDPATLATKAELSGYLPLSSKAVANGVASLDANAKVPSAQIPTATNSALGGVKPDGTTITVTEDGTISASVSGEGVATKADLQDRVLKAGDTMTGTLKMSGANEVRFGTDDNYYYVKKDSIGNLLLYGNNNKGLFLADEVANHHPYYFDGTKGLRLLTTADLENIDYVVESYKDDQGNWYRKYKSGWLEQGGVATAAGAVTLLKPFANTSYSVQATSLYTNYTNWGFGINKTSVSSFHLNMNTGTQGAMWEAKGQGAE